jgi:hypothetical protein
MFKKSILSFNIADLIAMLSLFYLLLALVVMPKGSFFSPDEGARVVVIESIIRNIRAGRFFDLSAIDYPGQGIDPEFVFFPMKAGWFKISEDTVHLTAWTPVFAFLCSLFYALFGLPGLHVVPIFSTALTLYISYLLTRRLTKDLAPLTVPLIALASPLFIYSLLVWEHTVAVALAVLTIWLAVEQIETDRMYFLPLALLSAGAATVLRPEISFFALAFLVSYFFTVYPLSRGRRSRWIMLLVGTAVSLSILLWLYYYYWHRRGSTSYFRALIPGLSPDLTDILLDFLVGLGPARELKAAFVLAIVAFVLCNFYLSRRRTMVTGLTSGALTVTGLLCFFAPVHERLNAGFVGASPFIVFAACNAGRALSTRTGRVPRFLALTALLCTANYVFLYTFSSFGDGSIAKLSGNADWSFRYTMVTYPLLTILAISALAKIRQDYTGLMKKSLLLCFLILALLGLGFQMRGLKVVYEDKVCEAMLNDALREIPAQHILTTKWWLAVEAATQFYDKEIFLLPHEPDSLKRWLTLAKTGGVSQFWYVGSDVPCGQDSVELFLGDTKMHCLETRHAVNLALTRIIMEEPREMQACPKRVSLLDTRREVLQ